jgi:hypothetical protein
MKLNYVTAGVELIGTTVKKLNIENNIVDIEKDGKRIFGLNINEPIFQKVEDKLFGQIVIDFEVEINQSDEQTCKIDVSIEGAFLSSVEADEKAFKELVSVNGAAALIGIARGNIESISANIFNSGKVTIPFVNVVDYYKSLME